MAQTRDRVRAVTAAARKVRNTSIREAREDAAEKQEWHDDAWIAYDQVPEVKFGINYLGNGMSKVVFYAATLDVDGNPVPINDEASPLAGTPIASAAEAELARLRGPTGGQGEINRMATINLETVGEFYLYGREASSEFGVLGAPDYQPALTELWDVRSTKSIDLTSETDADKRPIFTMKRSPKATGVKLNNDTEQLIRVWQRHPEWPELSDCHLAGCLTDVETLVLLGNQEKAEAKSRASAGAFTVPSELSFTRSPSGTDVDPELGDETAGNDGEGPDNDPDDLDPLPSRTDDVLVSDADDFISALADALINPIEDPTSAESVVPMLISGPAEFLKQEYLHRIDFSRGQDGALDARIEAKINRVARGLNIPVEVVLGHMSTTFANAKQIDKDTFADHHEPRCLMIADAYAVGFLRPNLLAQSFDPALVEAVIVWYDPAALVRSESLDVNADKLYEAGVIGATAYRRAKGATEDDAPTEQELLLNIISHKAILTENLSIAILKAVGIDIGLTAAQPGPTPQAGGPPPPGARVQDPIELATIVAHELGVTNVHDVVAALAAASQHARNRQHDAIVASARKATTIGHDLMVIDRDLRNRLLGAAEGAMARALERAGARLKSKAGTIREALRGTPNYACAQHLGPRVLASAGLNPDELLADAWNELHDQFVAWGDTAGDAALDVVARALSGMSAAERAALKVRQLSDIEQGWLWLEDALGQAGKEALFHPEKGAWAAEAAGEVADLTSRVPPGLIREALARAGGALGMGGAPGITAPTNKAPIGGIASGDLVVGTLSDHGASIEGYVWVYGPAHRAHPFEPHAELDGVQFVNFDDSALSNTSGWPETAFYFPGDHQGCVCDFEPVVIPVAPPTNLASPQATNDEA